MTRQDRFVDASACEQPRNLQPATRKMHDELSPAAIAERHLPRQRLHTADAVADELLVALE